MTPEKEPYVFVIAGPNGTGKTTFARRYLSHFADCRRFVNADLLAAGLSPFDVEAAAFQAGRLMLDELKRLEAAHVSFAFETTLSGRGHARFLRGLRAKGFSVHLFFLWPRSIELTLLRIAERVALGGHHVPEEDVRRRFARTAHNLLNCYEPVVDSWTIYDNAFDDFMEVARQHGSKRTILVREVFDAIVRTAAEGDTNEP